MIAQEVMSRVEDEVQRLVSKESCEAMETNRLLYTLLLPIAWLAIAEAWLRKNLSRLTGREQDFNSLLFDAYGRGCRMVRQGAATWRALDVLYNFKPGQGEGLSRLVDRFWLANLNSQAVRNRMRVVRHAVRLLVQEYAEKMPGQQIRIFSLASGSAQAILEAIRSLDPSIQERVRLTLIDLDQSALDFARKSAQRLGINGNLQVEHSNVFRIRRIAGRIGKPHIVEMVGLLDYLDNDRAVRLLNQVALAMDPEGVFLVANTVPNREASFLKWVSDWEMMYRTTGQLGELLDQSYFIHDVLVTEPQGIHALAICRVDPP